MAQVRDTLLALGFGRDPDSYRKMGIEVFDGIQLFWKNFNEYIEGKISPFTAAEEDDFNPDYMRKYDRKKLRASYLWQRCDFTNKSKLCPKMADDVDIFVRGVWSYLGGLEIHQIYGSLLFHPQDEMFDVLGKLSPENKRKLLDWYNAKMDKLKAKDKPRMKRDEDYLELLKIKSCEELFAEVQQSAAKE